MARDAVGSKTVEAVSTEGERRVLKETSERVEGWLWDEGEEAGTNELKAKKAEIVLVCLSEPCAWGTLLTRLLFLLQKTGQPLQVALDRGGRAAACSQAATEGRELLTAKEAHPGVVLVDQHHVVLTCEEGVGVPRVRVVHIPVPLGQLVHGLLNRPFPQPLPLQLAHAPGAGQARGG